MRKILLLFSVFLLVSSSTLGPFSFLPRFDQNEHSAWNEGCGVSDVDSGKNIGWFVIVHNKETQSYIGAAAITSKHVVTARTAVWGSGRLPTPIDSLELLVFKSTNMAGIDTTILQAPHYLKLTVKYKIAHVIIPTISEAEQFYNFTIIQIEDAFPENLNHVCLNKQPEGTIPARAIIDVFHLSTTAKKAYQKIPIVFGVVDRFCNEGKVHCEDRLLSDVSSGGDMHEGLPGDIWFRTVNGRDQLLGIGLKDGTAVSIAFWSDFICKLTGACVHGFETQSSRRHSEMPFFLDGVYHPYMKEDECSVEHRMSMVRQSTPFTRLTHTEQRFLKQECGKRSPENIEMDNSFLVTLVALKKDTKEIIKCSGVLISPLHVISTSSCLIHALKESNSVLNAIFPQRKPDSSEEDFPFQKEDLYDWYYSSAEVGKRWIQVEKVIAPQAQKPEKDIEFDFALAQLLQRIPTESYTKPICIYQGVVWNPMFNVVQQVETGKTDKHVSRKVQVHVVPQSMSGGPEIEKDEHNVIYFITSVALKMEHRGSAMISLSDDPQARKELIGFVVYQDEKKSPYPTRAVRVEYFSTFICVHTGVCKDGEKFERRLFAGSFIARDLSPNTGVASKYEKTASSGLLHDQELGSIIDVMMKEEPYRLTPAQNEELQAVCGKKPPSNRMFGGEEFAFADWPWAVFIGADVPVHKTIYVLCEGSFISRRHIITARHCLVPEPGSESFKRVVMYGGTKWTTQPESFRRVGIRKKIYPVNVDHHDIGIAELEHDFEGSSMGVVCLPKQSDYANDNFEKIGRFIGGGNGEYGQETGDRLKILAYNLTDPDVVLYVPRRADMKQLFFLSFRTVQSREAHGHAAMGDSGGPLLRRRLSDDRFVLYGVLKGNNNSRHCAENNCYDGWDMFTTAKYFVFDICRITGICPDPPTGEDPVADIEIDGSRVCK